MTPLQIIRKKRAFKYFAVFMALNLMVDYFQPTMAFALTSGPAQEEFASFEPVSTSDMVDLYSGDFNYNIPLLSVPGPNGGYPINIAYHSGVGMEQEASWVGLGWNINVGAINRQLRGIPDDFDGDDVTSRFSLRDNITVAIGFDASKLHSERYGIPQANVPGFDFQVYYNTYKGLGYRVAHSGLNWSGSLGSVGAGVHFDSQSGIGIEPNLTIKTRWTKNRLSASAGATINSYEGLQNFSFAISGAARQNNSKDGTSHRQNMVGVSASSSLSFGVQRYVPSVSVPMSNKTIPFDLMFGEAGKFTDFFLETISHNKRGAFESSMPGLWSGFVNVSQISEPEVTSDAHGYLYDDHVPAGDLRDFQREQFEYSKKLPNLPTSSVTYDIYQMSGQGVGGYFRPYHQDIRVFSNQNRENETELVRVNAEVGVDDTPGVPFDEYHFGLGFSIGKGGTYSGKWTDIDGPDVLFENDIDDYENTLDPSNEFAPFQVYGEKTAILLSNEDQLNDWDNDNALMVKLDEETSEGGWLNSHFIATSNITDGTSAYTPFDFTSNEAWLHKDQRQRRATNIEYYTSAQADLYGVTHNIGYEDAGSDGDWDNIAKTYSGTRAHHLSEISVLKPDGMRYIYGLPAYNIRQFDAYFSVTVPGSSANMQEADIPVTSGEIDPAGTPDNFVSETELPDYVHSWLLTTVVSADYLDLTGNGPSDDDYGYWVRFNYKKTAETYDWRVPYVKSSFNVGNASDPNDDKASFSFGEKEIYYITSIETKTHIAVFSTNPREDGLASDGMFATTKPSTITTEQQMYKLDSIGLYTKSEFYSNISSRVLNTSAVAIQKIHFRYSYNLCSDVPNNTGDDIDENGASVLQADPDNINATNGKLTLERLFFTYETSSRGELSPYVFHYADADAFTEDNPGYDRKNMDRWGNYKDNEGYSTYPFVDFPYTDQDVKPQSGVWTLKSIDLPTGATMQIVYEPDEYKYVEGEKALRMFDIVGTNENNGTGTYYTSRGSSDNPVALESNAEMAAGKFKLYFKLEEPYSSYSTANVNDYFEKYLGNGEQDTVYYKVDADIKGVFGSYYDYVSGYARVSYGAGEYDLISSAANGIYDVGYITLLGEDLGGFNNVGPVVHPFTKAGIEHVRYNRPDIAHTPVPQTSDWFDQTVNVISSIAGSLNDVVSMVAGYNQWAYMKGFSKKIRLNGRSVIRLQDPDAKYGGGDRVKEIRLSDTWKNGASSGNWDEYSYGQKYSYVLEDGTSSGVAYEPHIGGDESALRTPVPYENSSFMNMKGTQHLFIEKPLMESYYPGAQVGYSRVVVESLGPDNAFAESVGSDNHLLHTSAPISIYEFYTAKDFPVLVDQTPITADRDIVRPIMIPGIYSNFKKFMAKSQGYSVVLNDMAGKPKSIEIRTRPTATSSSGNYTGSLISKQTFIYNTEEVYSPGNTNKLSSKVQVMEYISGAIKYQTAVVGQSHDIFIDMNENREWMRTIGVDVNLDLQFNGSTPTFIFLMPLVNVSKNDVRQRTVVVNKVIHRSGILKEVITQDHESTVKQTFMAFDRETGEPVLTKITNEYEKDVFGFTYPAHWYYPALQGAYKNFGVTISSATSPGTFPFSAAASGGRINLQNHLPAAKTTTDYFAVGDKLWIDAASGTDKVYTVIKVGVSGSDEYIDCVDEDGLFLPNSLSINSIRVIRSGYQNLQTMAAGNITSKIFGVTPYDAPSSTGLASSPVTVTIDESNEIINASAVEYSDVWQSPCKDCDGTVMAEAETNPFRWGIRGKWRPLQSFAYDTTRTQNDNIREDGLYVDFQEFPWSNPASADENWVTAMTITKRSPDGFELENKDAIGNYSSALFEFNGSVVTAIGTQTRHKEMAFDAFEDYAYVNACNQQFDHWGFLSTSLPDVTTDEHHTGSYSLKITQATGSKAITRILNNKNCETYAATEKTVVPPTDGTASEEYIADTCDCVGTFSPIIGKKYVISTWVKETGAATPPTTYADAQVKVELLNLSGVPITGGTYTFNADGPIIEGWQRVYGTFEMLSGTYSIRVSYVNNTSTGIDCYFDDIRLHPFDASMVTYVYDPVSLKRVAELDANNFATFYIYDEEGQLSAIKKETTEGIKTLREGRSVTKPNNQ